MRQVATRVREATVQAADDAKIAVKGTLLFAGDGVGQILSPVKQLFDAGPLGSLGQSLTNRVEQHRTEPILGQQQRVPSELVPRFPSANSR